MRLIAELRFIRVQMTKSILFKMSQDVNRAFLK
jgi:hypothetical protein